MRHGDRFLFLLTVLPLTLPPFLQHAYIGGGGWVNRLHLTLMLLGLLKLDYILRILFSKMYEVVMSRILVTIFS